MFKKARDAAPSSISTTTTMAPNTMTDEEKLAMHLASFKLAMKDARTPTNEEFAEHLEKLRLKVNRPLHSYGAARPTLPAPCWPPEFLVDEDTDEVFPGRMVNKFVEEHGLEKATQMCDRSPIPVEKSEKSKLEVKLEKSGEAHRGNYLRASMEKQFEAWYWNQRKGLEIISIQGTRKPDNTSEAKVLTVQIPLDLTTSIK